MSIIFSIFLILSFYKINGYTAVNLARKTENNLVKETSKEEIKEYTFKEEYYNNWYIEIPKINLIAPISEGTTQEIMSKYVGHFENTSVWEGNVGLAAHNRRISSKLF